MTRGRVRRPHNIGGAMQRRHRPDYWLLIISLVLAVVGLIVVYAISPGLSAQKHVGENYYVGKQLVAIGLSIIAFIAVSQIPLKYWRHMEKPLILSAIVASIAVRLFGERVNGAYRWVQIGGLSFQAAELIKFAVLLWLAGFLTDRFRNNELKDYHKTLRPMMIALGIIGVVVAVLQSDLGSTGVLVAIMATMSFVAGLPLKRIAIVGAIILIGTTLAIASSGYRRERLGTFLNPTRDCQSSGYQACQALIAVGSGGMFGLGLARSVQAYGYLPEAANDSIFAIYAEKFGFVGSTILLGLFFVLFARLKFIIERTPDIYSRLLVSGVLAWISTQAIINIGAMLGLLPLKGITLPLISYGGTSLVFVAAAMGLVFNISRYTTYSVLTKSTDTNREGSYEGKDFAGRRRVRGAYHPTFGSR